MRTTIVWKILAILAVLAMLAGCSAATPTAAVPTVDPKPTFDAVQTQAVATAVMAMTQNAPTATVVVPTDTVIPPTATLMPTATVPAGPTNTPVPPTATITPTRPFIAWTQTPTAGPVDYQCSITAVSPKATDKLTVGQSFDGKWSLKNTGTKTWSAGDVDVRYSAGTKFQTKTDLVDLPNDVAPNGTVDIVVDMAAPSTDGTYNTTWVMGLPDGASCNLTLSFNVTK